MSLIEINVELRFRQLLERVLNGTDAGWWAAWMNFHSALNPQKISSWPGYLKNNKFTHLLLVELSITFSIRVLGYVFQHARERKASETRWQFSVTWRWPPSQASSRNGIISSVINLMCLSLAGPTRTQLRAQRILVKSFALVPLVGWVCFSGILLNLSWPVRKIWITFSTIIGPWIG